jgi:hypothetical protein
MICSQCNLELPDRMVFKCDGHCPAILCISCIKTHAVDVTMTYRAIPKLVGGKK